MFEIPVLIWFIPCLPLASAILTAILGPRVLKSHSHLPTIIAVAGSCAITLAILVGMWRTDNLPVDHHLADSAKTKLEPPEIRAPGYTWFASTLHSSGPPLDIADLVVQVNLSADTLTMVMLTAITFVGTWIAIFSAGYMRGEAGYARYFAVMSLFIFSMTGLVLADNYLLLYAFWEGVGLCSYLLIGFWFDKPSAAAAARKAFLVTRLGDAGMIVGIMMLWSKFGHKLDYHSIFEQAKLQSGSPYITMACLFLFCGAVGKSAQFPLHVWLPDAMEGPTPVSALIHAATMVTAGVYLVARSTPLFILVPEVQLVVAGIGGFTALLAALIALTQTDLKRVLAYSTVSQLGYMFLALGAGLREQKLAVFAVSAAIFHLFTHAFFKALLFLSAGSVMHGMGHVIDMRRFSGLRKVMPITHITFACGALALAGLIPFSGFWSKDQILEATIKASEHSDPYETVYLVLFVVALITAALTAFYTFRAYFKTFWGETLVPEEAYHHGHGGHTQKPSHAEFTPHHSDETIKEEPSRSFESPSVMTVPLIVLAVGAVFIGLVFEATTHWFTGFLARSVAFQPFDGYIPEQEFNFLLVGLSTLCAVGGIGVAWFFYVSKPSIPVKLAKSMHWAYELSLNRFRIDEIYSALFVRPLEVIAIISRFFDAIVDGIVDLIGHAPRLIARLLQPVQNGLVQFYALFIMVFLTALMAIFVLWIR
jgi:NADH-quinone oxidoreductase subunit L